jgi:hypothetical protein
MSRARLPFKDGREEYVDDWLKCRDPFTQSIWLLYLISDDVNEFGEPYELCVEPTDVKPLIAERPNGRERDFQYTKENPPSGYWEILMTRFDAPAR